MYRTELSDRTTVLGINALAPRPDTYTVNQRGYEAALAALMTWREWQRHDKGRCRCKKDWDGMCRKAYTLHDKAAALTEKALRLMD